MPHCEKWRTYNFSKESEIVEHLDVVFIVLAELISIVLPTSGSCLSWSVWAVSQNDKRHIVYIWIVWDTVGILLYNNDILFVFLIGRRVPKSVVFLVSSFLAVVCKLLPRRRGLSRRAPTSLALGASSSRLAFSVIHRWESLTKF